MKTELEQVRDRTRDLITSTCNIVGCDNCPYKWDTDEDGNSCQYDYLLMLKCNLKKALTK